MRDDILLLLGPSGAGKSTLGRWLGEDLGMLHIEMDRWPEGNGIDLEGLRGEWTDLARAARGGPLAVALRGRFAAAGRRGAVLSFPSGVVLDAAAAAAAGGEGMRPFVLHGTREECLGAFLERERATGRDLGPDHWARYNGGPYRKHAREALAAYRLRTFAGGGRRAREDLVAEVRARLAP